MSGAMTQYYAIELRIMAASSASGGEGKLGATSEWLVANTGQLRSQFMEQAVKQVSDRTVSCMWLRSLYYHRYYLWLQ